MLYLTLMKILPEKAADQIGFSKRINSVPPPSDINIRGAYFSFGQHDGAILFEASNHRTVKNLLSACRNLLFVRLRLRESSQQKNSDRSQKRTKQCLCQEKT